MQWDCRSPFPVASSLDLSVRTGNFNSATTGHEQSLDAAASRAFADSQATMTTQTYPHIIRKWSLWQVLMSFWLATNSRLDLIQERIRLDGR